MEKKTIYTIEIIQNIDGKTQQIIKFNFESRKIATDNFKGLKETCKIMSLKHYTVMRLFKDEIELAKFSWSNGRNQSHSIKNDLINVTEIK